MPVLTQVMNPGGIAMITNLRLLQSLVTRQALITRCDQSAVRTASVVHRGSWLKERVRRNLSERRDSAAVVWSTFVSGQLVFTDDWSLETQEKYKPFKH
jgi:hypothetical protein